MGAAPEDEAALAARATTGEGEAQVRLANLLMAPGRDAEDRAAGEALLREAAAAGHPMGLMVLGQRLLYGMGLETDVVAGEAALGAAAETGFAPAMEAWGRHRLAGAPEEGAGWLRKAAEAGFAPAMAEWAACLLDGVGVAADAAEGERWLREGMAKNLGRAYAMMAAREADPAAAEGLLHEALRRRDVPAGLALGMRRYGRGDFAGAASAWASCLKLGADAARINVAAMVRRGEWPRERPAPPVGELLAPLVAAGDAFAVVNLALWHAARGEAAAAEAVVAGLPREGREAAIAWWRGLAERGEEEGVLALGWLA